MNFHRIHQKYPNSRNYIPRKWVFNESSESLFRLPLEICWLSNFLQMMFMRASLNWFSVAKLTSPRVLYPDNWLCYTVSCWTRVWDRRGRPRCHPSISYTIQSAELKMMAVFLLWHYLNGSVSHVLVMSGWIKSTHWQEWEVIMSLIGFQDILNRDNRGIGFGLRTTHLYEQFI